MGKSLDIAKTVLIPAAIALALYIVFSFVFAPVIRRYHQRYAHYLPLHAISAHTASLRSRIGDAVMRITLFAALRQRLRPGEPADRASVYSEDGEIMVGMHMDPGRREALEHRGNLAEEAEGRLNRDLEEGFIDDSDNEADGHRGRRAG